MVTMERAATRRPSRLAIMISGTITSQDIGAELAGKLDLAGVSKRNSETP